MDAYFLIRLIALFLWCYALVLTIAWFRAVRGEDRRTHVGHFVSLIGVFVPVSCGLVAMVFLCAYLQVAALLVMLIVLLPAGFVVGLQLEVSRLTGSTERLELARLGATACLFGAVILWQGGV